MVMDEIVLEDVRETYYDYVADGFIQIEEALL